MSEEMNEWVNDCSFPAEENAAFWADTKAT